VIAGAGFNDGDFTTYAWASVKLQDTTSGQNAEAGAGEAPTGGYQGGAYRSNSFSFSFNGAATNQGILIGNTNSGMVYSPAVSGAINSINFGIAANESVSVGTTVVSIGLLLLQSNIYYTNQLQEVAAGSWANLKESSPLLAADFTRVGSSEPVNPDFTTNGAPIQFGYATAASLSSGTAGLITGTIGADDYQLSISNTPGGLRFTSQQPANATNLSVTLSGLAAGENITWLVSTNLAVWSTNNSNSSATGTNGAFTVTNSIYPAARDWFLRALVQ
jgi:hypothetical protein